MSPHALKERNNVIHRSRRNKFPVIEPETYPEVIHENGKTNHHRCDTPWATKLVSGEYILVGISHILDTVYSRLMLVQELVNFATFICGGRRGSG